MTICRRHNVRKHRDIKNGEQCIIFDISSKLDCLDKREVTHTESKYYMGRPGKGLNTSMDLMKKNPNKKQKARFSITEITNQDFRKLLNKFKNSPFLGYKFKNVQKEPDLGLILPNQK